MEVVYYGLPNILSVVASPRNLCRMIKILNYLFALTADDDGDDLSFSPFLINTLFPFQAVKM